MNESEPLLEAPLAGNEVKTVVYAKSRDTAHRVPDSWVSGLRRTGGMNFTLAAVGNSGNHRVGCKSKGTRCQPPRPIVEMPTNGAEQLVVAMKASNAAGAKGLRQHGQFMANSDENEP